MNPHQRCLQAKVKYRNEPKQAMPKSENLSRSLEINAIWTFEAPSTTSIWTSGAPNTTSHIGYYHLSIFELLNLVHIS